jgi:hypothetical protein
LAARGARRFNCVVVVFPLHVPTILAVGRN